MSLQAIVTNARTAGFVGAAIRDVRYALANTTKTALIPYQQKVKDAQTRVNQVKEFGETLKDRVLAIET